MHLRNCLFLTLALLILRPLAVNSKERFEINFGISTPGMYESKDTRFEYLGAESFDDYDDEPLSDLEEPYNITVYPFYSIEFSYDLAESGFFKRLDLVGFVSYHSAKFEEIDIINNTSIMETARKVNILIGLRYDIFKEEDSNMYAQILSGGGISNSSGYWDYIYSDMDDGSHTTMQLTLGFNRRLGGEDSKWGLMTEFGYGTEFSAGKLPLIPGMRMGLSYKF
jgi:hypothetical protein